MITLPPSPEYAFCEAVIGRLAEQADLSPLVLPEPYDSNDQTSKLAMASRQYQGAIAVMPVGLGMDWQGVDAARVSVWTARVAILALVTTQVSDQTSARRVSDLTAAIIRQLTRWDPTPAAGTYGDPWFVDTADLDLADVADLKNMSGRAIMIARRIKI